MVSKRFLPSRFRNCDSMPSSSSIVSSIVSSTSSLHPPTNSISLKQTKRTTPLLRPSILLFLFAMHARCMMCDAAYPSPPPPSPSSSLPPSPPSPPSPPVAPYPPFPPPMPPPVNGSTIIDDIFSEPWGIAGLVFLGVLGILLMARLVLIFVDCAVERRPVDDNAAAVQASVQSQFNEND